MHNVNQDKFIIPKSNANAVPAPGKQEELRILTYNIQTGLPSSNLRDQVTASWRHIFPTTARQENLSRIAEVLQDYDVVALQEIDPGSIRTGFMNQVQYLAHMSGFPHWYLQVNRTFGKFAKHSNAVLSRYRPFDSTNHKLPWHYLGPWGYSIVIWQSRKSP